MDKAWIYIAWIVPFMSLSSFNPCSISDNRTVVDCSNRGLTTIPVVSNSTECFDLSGNNITVIRNSSFIHLRRLRYLNMNRNYVAHIQTTAFSGLGELRYLLLRQNKIDILKWQSTDPSFEFTPKLLHLDLSYNSRAPLDGIAIYPDRVFASFTNLQELHIGLLPNPVFGEGFKEMTKLRKIVFKECTIMHLKNDTFKNFENISSLTYLDLSDCQVNIRNEVKIEKGILQYFHYLDYLDISDTSITFPVAMDILYGLTVNVNHSHPVRKLKVLNLYNVNPLKLLWMNDVEYAVKVTKKMTKYYKLLCVEEINLGKNGIVEIEVGSLDAFVDYSCLKKLYCAENNFILAFPKFMFSIITFFSRAVNLELIDYSYIAIQFPAISRGSIRSNTYVESHGMTDTEQISNKCVIPFDISFTLRYLYVSHLLFPFSFLCDVDLTLTPTFSVFDISYNTFESLDFQMKGLKSHLVDISGLDFETSGRDLLGSFKRVHTLVLQNGNLDRAFSNGNYIFKDMQPIEELDISLNHLNSLPADSLSGLESLRKINVSWNFMKEFPQGFYAMRNLDFIDFSSNKLIFLDQTTMAWLDSMHSHNKGHNITVLLHGNPLSCTCDTMDFVQWIYTTNVKLDIQDYTCILKDGKTVNLTEVNNNYGLYFANCNYELFWLKFSISGTSLLFLALVLAITAYKYRWRILYFLYRNCKTEIQNEDSTEYEYDVFVAYNSSDSPWVWQELRPRLEQQYHIKLCLHERDFNIGEPISQNIVNYQHKSRKILFIVSKEFIAARWFEFEMEMANMERVDRGLTNTIIVVMKDDVQENSMPRCISNIWNSITNLIYPTEENDMAAFDWFWGKLYESVKTPN